MLQVLYSLQPFRSGVLNTAVDKTQVTRSSWSPFQFLYRGSTFTLLDRLAELYRCEGHDVESNEEIPRELSGREKRLGCPYILSPEKLLSRLQRDNGLLLPYFYLIL